MRAEPFSENDITSFLKNTDAPIRREEDDLLNQKPFVAEVARLILRAPEDQSNVFGLFGPWGSGKTSIKNLLVKSLQGLTSPHDTGPKLHVVEFNPWAFSSQGEIMGAFFREISDELSGYDRLKEVARSLAKLGEFLDTRSDLVDLLGPGPLATILESIAKFLKGVKPGTEDGSEGGTASLRRFQHQLRRQLSSMDGSILIILDDLDRLPPSQLVTVFQIVRQNLCLPKLNFLLLMDRVTVTQHLVAEKFGPDYLDKIVQCDLDIPRISDRELRDLIISGHQSLFGKLWDADHTKRFDEAWRSGLKQVLGTLRRVKRMLQSTRFHKALLGDGETLEVDPVDLVVVETLRKHAPSVHGLIPILIREALGQLDDPLLPHIGPEQLKAIRGSVMEQIREAAPSDARNAVETLMRFLFPQLTDSDQRASGHLPLKCARICHPLFLPSYFRLSIPTSQLTQSELAKVFAVLDDPPSLSALLSELSNRVGLPHILSRVAVFMEKVGAGHVSNLLTVIWQLENAFVRGLNHLLGDLMITSDCQQVSEELIRARIPTEQRSTLLLSIADQSLNYTILAAIVLSEMNRHDSEEMAAGRIVARDQLKALKEQTLARISTLARDENLIARPDALTLIVAWKELGGAEQLQRWIATNFLSTSKLPRLLRSLLQRSLISDSEGTRPEYRISLGALEICGLKDPKILLILKQIDIKSLEPAEALAVSDTLKLLSYPQARSQPTHESEEATLPPG